MTTRKTTKTLKNTYSESPRIFEDIQKTLVAHGARSAFFEYSNDGTGRIISIEFALDVQGRALHFRMPARTENIERIFVQQKGRRLTDAEKNQAYRTAWANIRDWIAAQFALIDTEMVTKAEIFLPYLLNTEGQTFYEAMESRQFLLGPGGQ